MCVILYFFFIFTFNNYLTHDLYLLFYLFCLFIIRRRLRRLRHHPRPPSLGIIWVVFLYFGLTRELQFIILFIIDYNCPMEKFSLSRGVAHNRDCTATCGINQFPRFVANFFFIYFFVIIFCFIYF